MISRVYTGCLNGIDSEKVTVEVDLCAGIPNLVIVGLPDTSVNESKERIKAAIKNAGFEFPLKKIVVNLAPAHLRKEGTGFDLPLCIGILLAFGVMHGAGGDYTFDAMRASEPGVFWASAAFLLALVGFGAKAGLLPLHVWLPEAHPAAPSPVSALMSAVMLKTAIYGLLRVSFDLLSYPVWWWGVAALVVGLLTALYGVMFAAVQTDMKRLLAYSSIENIGVIAAGLGLALVFRAYGNPHLAALALVATLYHCLNHACFKSLLFLGTGSVLHATHERSLGKLGGLIRSMPWVAGLTLVGALAIAGLPPLNGFVSEWLLLQAFLFAPGLPNPYLNMLVPLGSAALVLAAAREAAAWGYDVALEAARAELRAAGGQGVTRRRDAGVAVGREAVHQSAEQVDDGRRAEHRAGRATQFEALQRPELDAGLPGGFGVEYVVFVVTRAGFQVQGLRTIIEHRQQDLTEHGGSSAAATTVATRPPKQSAATTNWTTLGRVRSTAASRRSAMAW